MFNDLFPDDEYDLMKDIPFDPMKTVIIPKGNQKYLLFAGETIDCGGGFSDYIQTFDALDDAKTYAEERLCGFAKISANCKFEWAHIAVVETNDVQYLVMWNQEVKTWLIQSTSTVS